MSKRPIIALDAGHGLHTLGKRCLKAIDLAETREWWLNDRIADRVQELMASFDCTVIRVDDTTGARDISLTSRVKTANAAAADIYISIHHNAGIKGGTGGGTVVYYCSSAAVRPLQAQRLYNAVTARTGLFGNRYNKINYHGYYVIRKTTMPALLIENGFMDSKTDTPIILSATHAERTAQGIVDFLTAELHLKAAQEGPQQLQTGELIAAGNNQPVSGYYPAYTGPKTTLSAAMTALGLDASYAHRKLIAKANNISAYVGTAAQNTQMYNLLAAGLLKKE
ncbi:MAG: N-acetylmuramoyl-L-alanine amidase [Lachnospiraceae bacterium]|nr:N-acetylmuramoyl-L-alanine amidase [Lachnospiraceae bacterium]